MSSISLAIITHNSEMMLEQTLQSVKGLVSEIILVDDHSTDDTVQIAKKHDARIVTRKLESCAGQKQHALEQAKNEWIFLLDSDETCSEDLKKEIISIVSNKSRFAAYRIPRRNHYFGQWLAHGGKYPDYQVRLYQKGAVHYSDHFSHEKVIVQGQTGTLKGWMDHQAYPDLEIWWMKARRTAEFDALEWARKGIQPSFFNFLRLCIFRPKMRFISKYIVKRGFLDGIAGFMAAFHDTLTQVLTYYFLSRKSDSAR